MNPSIVLVVKTSGVSDAYIHGPVRPGESVPIDHVQYGESLIECMEPRPRLRVGRPTHVGYLEHPRHAVETGHEVTTLVFYDDRTRSRAKIQVPVQTRGVWHE